MVLGGITVACLSNIISILQNVDAVVSMHELINALYFTIHAVSYTHLTLPTNREV